MMKLRHLFHNPDLAEMLLKNWEYEESSLELFQYFRISANAIYPFRQNGGVCYLRFCPASEKRKEAIAAELEYLEYLRGAHYPAVEAVPAITGEVLVQKTTPWGEYYASAFKRVPGMKISETGFEDEILLAYGAALGQLHRLSRAYTAPKKKRWTHTDVFAWIEATLGSLAAGPAPLEELRLLRDGFSSLPILPENYGLVHYDFEPDNVFYDAASGGCSVIDFDVAVYHWYVMDIILALDSLEREISGDAFSHKKAVFIEGYSSQYAIDEALWAAQPLLRRFASLYRYTRSTRALQDQWENEPAWLATLRMKLSGIQAADARQFGKAI